MRPVLLATDAAAIRARRLLAAMIDAEARSDQPVPLAIA
jgi:vanillate O-demethylase monooxygenase subunit